MRIYNILLKNIPNIGFLLSCSKLLFFASSLCGNAKHDLRKYLLLYVLGKRISLVDIFGGFYYAVLRL